MSATKLGVDAPRLQPSIDPQADVWAGKGDDAFLVPRDAVNETTYPLFGLRHAAIDVPRQTSWQQLKTWLAVERKVHPGPWPQVWRRAITKKPSFFQRCAVVSLARSSRSLPAGNVVFEELSDFVAIPESELANLSVHDRDRVRAACVGAMLDFPDDHPLVLLRPIYVGGADARRLAKPVEVQEAARQRHDMLYQYCRDRGERVRLEESEEHLCEAQAERALRVEIVRRRISQLAYERTLWRERLARLAHQLEFEELSLPSADRLATSKEALSLITIGRRLGLPLRDRDAALARYMLSLIDPVVVIEEPRWRLPCHGENESTLRAAVHWDDAGVTLLA